MDKIWKPNVLNLTDLLTTAERELASSDTLARTTKAGILFGVLHEAVRRYTQTPVTTNEVLALMTVLVRDGKLLDSLPRSDGIPFSPSRLAGTDEPEAPSRTSSLGERTNPEPRLTPEEEAEREEDIRVMRANGYSDTEIEAILSLKDAAAAGTEVISRTDAELARYEEEKENPFPGVPRGLQLRPNGITSDFTMTPPEPVPSDLSK